MISNEVLEKIRNDRLVLLSNARECIISNGNAFGVSASEISKVLDEEEKTSKKMETIINIQEYINELATRIVNAKDENEIIEIRKELNKSINKVKNEMIKRNIKEQSIIDYQEKAKYLRKDISRLIRYHKRIEKINRIEELNVKEDFSEDEKIELKKLIKNEKSYNKKNIKNYVIQKNNQIIGNKALSFEKMNEDFCFDGSMEEFFEETTKTYNEQYGIIPTEEYTKSRFKNAFIFLKNIFKCRNNNKRIKYIQNDLMIFYNGDDLIAYMDYVRNRNSLIHGLRSIFSKTYLNSDYSKSLNEHNKCAEWLKQFYTINGFELPKVKVKTV